MKKMCHPFAMEFFDAPADPITPFSKHESSLLESALGNPRQTFGGKDLYQSIEEKAFILYYGLIKNHPFENCNKRTATATLLTFLYINHLWIRSKGDETDNFLVTLAERVADSHGDEQKNIFKQELVKFLQNHMITLREKP